MKNKNSYEEVLEAEVAKLKEENRHLTDERDELKYMLNDMHSVVDAATAEHFQNRQILKMSQQKVMKEKSNLFTKLMGLFKKGDK